MANPITKCMILAILFVGTRLIHAQQAAVPALFLFGDSLFDNGNNNNLISLSKANYPPYGNDFPLGPTGRFSNGQNIPDFLAQALGFTSSSPPFATAGGTSDILLGVNFASGSAGIRVETSSPLFATAGGTSAVLQGVNFGSGSAGILEETSLQTIQRISMNQQLVNHQEIVNQIENLIGNSAETNNRLRRSLYAFSAGMNDYINNYYLLPVTPSRLLETPEAFAAGLIQQLSQQLRTLYNLGARKVVVFGINPLGCTPQALLLYPANSNGSCVDFINTSVQLFNSKLISLVRNFNTNLPGARFTYINSYSILSGNFSANLGIKVPNAPCCTTTLLGGCVPYGGVCSNRDEYTYFDNINPTQIVHRFLASRAFVSQSPSHAIPVDIRTLARQ